MKQTLRRELTNILFLVLIVAAAVAIYLLSRGESGARAQTSAQAATPTPAAEESAEPEGAATRQQTPRGVPEAVFRTCLATSELFSAEPERRDDHAFAIGYGENPIIHAALRYELNDGCLSSLELTFPLPYVVKGKGNSGIDAFLKESAEELTRVQGDAILTLMSDILPACDARDELQSSSVRYWVEQALLLKKVGDDFEDTQGSYRFLAYRSQRDVTQELICVFYLT